MITFLVYTPFTGLGLYNGFRGNRWLRNRIKIFKQFVIPSLQNQTDQDFIHWISWREEERNNPYVKELHKYLTDLNYNFVFTYGGVCFWDDKYDDNGARERLALALHKTIPNLLSYIGDEVHMLIQPSDDLYHTDTIKQIKNVFRETDAEAVSFVRGYICNYNTLEIREYNPTTNPPFYAIKFSRDNFIDPAKHLLYTSIKTDVGKYKAGTPIPSHEYVGNALKLVNFEIRGFLVGTHGENISTHFNHPFGGLNVSGVEDDFGIKTKLKLPKSLRKWVMRHLPYKWQKKLRYWWGERLFNWFYEFIRG